jgi:aryl-alcohol dehydrogenase-like predicted oxidoreductase
VGINLFDTAVVYGGPQSPDMDQGYGISEEIIGRSLPQGGRRERIVLATKVYQPMGPRTERQIPVGVPHSQGLRGQPASAEDRSHAQHSPVSVVLTVMWRASRCL